MPKGKNGADIGAITPRGSPITKRNESMLVSASKRRLLCESFAMRKTRAKHSLDKDGSQRARLGNIVATRRSPTRSFSALFPSGRRVASNSLSLQSKRHVGVNNTHLFSAHLPVIHSTSRSRRTKKEKHHKGASLFLERITGLEPATSTLARSRSTK